MLENIPAFSGSLDLLSESLRRSEIPSLRSGSVAVQAALSLALVQQFRGSSKRFSILSCAGKQADSARSSHKGLSEPDSAQPFRGRVHQISPDLEFKSGEERLRLRPNGIWLD